MIDYEAFQEEMEMDLEMVMDMYSLFCEDLLVLEKELQETGKGNKESLRGIAHSIKGIALTYKAYDLVREAEALGKSLLEFSQGDEVAGTKRLEQQIVTTLQDLDHLLKQNNH